jgi:hypothetical protein
VADAAVRGAASFFHMSAVPVAAGVACLDTLHLRRTDFVLTKIKVKFTLRLIVYGQSVLLGLKHLEVHD